VGSCKKFGKDYRSCVVDFHRGRIGIARRGELRNWTWIGRSRLEGQVSALLEVVVDDVRQRTIVMMAISK
jgi:hypothetical protein